MFSAIVPEATPLPSSQAPFLRDIAVIAAVAFGILVLLLLWAAYLRGPTKKRRRGEAGRKVYSPPPAKAEDENPNVVRRRYKVRYRRRAHRSRNPSLADSQSSGSAQTSGEAAADQA